MDDIDACENGTESNFEYSHYPQLEGTIKVTCRDFCYDSRHKGW